MTWDRSMMKVKSSMRHPPCLQELQMQADSEFRAKCSKSCEKNNFLNFEAENSQKLQFAAPPVAKSHNLFLRWKNNVTSSSYINLIEFGWIAAFLAQFECWFHPCAFLAVFAHRFFYFANRAKSRKFWKNPKNLTFSWMQ